MVFSGFFEEPKQQRARPRFTQKEKEMLYKYQGEKCNGCNKKFDIRNLAVDHIKAFSKGGSDRGNNTQLLCTACNSAKGAGTQGQLKKRLAQQGVTKEPAKGVSKPAAKKKPATKKKPVKSKDPFADLFNF